MRVKTQPIKGQLPHKKPDPIPIESGPVNNSLHVRLCEPHEGLVISHCAFSVYVDGCGRLIVIAKDEKEVADKMKAEGFTKPFKILEALSFIA